MNKSRIIAGVIGLLIVIAGSVFWSVVYSPHPSYTGELTLPGLKGSVTVYYDNYAIPHIVASNELDLFFAQGYLTASERMFQMDVNRRAGRGELSVLFGEKTVDKDRYLKTIGLYRTAQKGYRAMGPRARNIIMAYTEGVNAYIDTVSALPFEYTVLRTRPEKWKPEDSVAVALLMSYSLTRSKKIDLALHKLGMQRGRSVLKLLSPAYPEGAPSLTGLPLRSSSRSKTMFNLYPDKDRQSSVDNLLLPNIPLEFSASNWMIFSGKRTVSGKPLFAGSPDLKPTLPALFYLVHLICKKAEINVMGGALPGTPAIGPLGYNGHIAWSAVNGRGDEMDYYLEKVNPDDSSEYLTETGYRKFEKITETLKIKVDGKITEKPLEVLLTRHGPVISNVVKGVPKYTTMQWAAHKVAVTDIEGLLEMNSARNFQEFRKALKKVRTINLGLGYADKKGNIGWQFLASPPVRKKGDGTLPVPGWTGEYEWTGFIPYERVPHDLNPGRGWIASFNNDPGTTKEHFTNFYLFKRAMRYEEIMKEKKDEKFDYQGILDLQLDTVSITAQQWVPRVLAAIKGKPELERYYGLLKAWDCRFDMESEAATLFGYFYARLMQNTLSDDTGPELWKEFSQSYLHYIPDLFLLRFGDKNNHIAFDDNRTSGKKETRDDIIVKSMEESVAYLSERFGSDVTSWQWGRGHVMPFTHQLGSVLGFLNLPDYSTNGSHGTINSGFWDMRKPFEMDSGGVIRMIVDFGNSDKSTIISPPGQSGHFMNKHYGDLAQTWAEGKQVPMRFDSYKSLKNVLILNPGGK